MKKICYVRDKDVIKKYAIYFDEHKVMAVRERILERTCLVIPRVLNSTYLEFNKKDDTFIRNIKRGKKIDVYDCECETSSDIYEYSYDEYIPSPFINAIDMFLKDANEFIELVNFKNFTSASDTLNKQIDATFLECSSISNDSIDKINKIIEKLNELEFLLELLKVNKDKVCDDKYKDMLMGLFNVSLVDKVDINDVEKLRLFFDGNNLENSAVRKKDV